VDTDRRCSGAYCLHHQSHHPLKRRPIFARLHGATSQKTAIFILVAVRT
jgi:hypothetical protein